MKEGTMKPATLQLEKLDAGEDRLNELSAESTIRFELARLGSWLAEQGLDPRDDSVDADAGSRDRLYWRLGYFTGLKQALAALTGGDATRH
jgi:hypothetical protein